MTERDSPDPNQAVESSDIRRLLVRGAILTFLAAGVAILVTVLQETGLWPFSPFSALMVAIWALSGAVGVCLGAAALIPLRRNTPWLFRPTGAKRDFWDRAYIAFLCLWAVVMMGPLVLFFATDLDVGVRKPLWISIAALSVFIAYGTRGILRRCRARVR